MSGYVFDAEKWQALSLFEQMGNIGSEVGRAMNAMEHDDKTSAFAAYHRGLDLIDATIASWSSPTRRRELMRARELFTQAVASCTADRKLKAYFMQYAVAARLRR